MFYCKHMEITTGLRKATVRDMKLSIKSFGRYPSHLPKQEQGNNKKGKNE